MRAVRSVPVCLVVVAALSGCSGGEDVTPASTVAATTTEARSVTTEPGPQTTQPTPETTAPSPQDVVSETTSPPPPTLPPPVPDEGSARDVISQREQLSNIDAAIDAWLADSPGREGVLRNGRGVTLFLPDDEGFTADDLAIALADFDAFTIFLSHHLRVGALSSDQLGEGVSTAMGVTYEVTDGPSIGGRLILEADIAATNGVIYIIDGPLVPIG